MTDGKRVAIIGGSFWGNRGAAAMLETTIAKVKEINPTVQFTIFSPYPTIDQSLIHNQDFEFLDSKPIALIKLNIKTLWLWFLRKLGLNSKPSEDLKLISEAELLLDIGGITFSDGRLLFLPYNILTILPAILFGIPVVKLSQAAGSFKNPIIRTFAKYFLPKCDFTFARGEQTFSFLKQIGLSENRVALAMDATFAYDKNFCLTDENSTAIEQVSTQLLDLKINNYSVIGISPSILVMEKMTAKDTDYLDYLIEMIKKASFEKNAHFVVFPNASREKSKKKRNNDILVIEEMQIRAKQELPFSLYNTIIWLPFDIDTKGLDTIVNLLDLLITSRFHAMVFGLRLAVPTMVIGWSHKYFEVMKFFKQEKYVFDYNDANQSFDQLILEMMAKKATIRDQISDQLPEAKALSQTQFTYLKRFLL